ncbi:MAG: PAC2 family protein [Actinomycetota bacterium]|nr:PAC2 family protein [Actinomycetota bacterium]
MDDRMRRRAPRFVRPLPGSRARRVGGPLRYLRRPVLDHPVVLAAFEGWNDAGEAASYATAYLERSWGAVPVAEIDPEEFFDFTEVRPEVAIAGDGRREISWPATRIMVAASRTGERDVVLVRGHEPHLRWRSYAEVVAEVARGLRADQVVTLGAYLSEVTHTGPVPVNAASSSAGTLDRYGLSPSFYEGPTGIVGVLGLVLPEAGIPTATVWASVPCYSLPVSAKAALALVRVVTRLTGRPVATEELEEEAAEYEQRMDELVRDDESVAAYVARLEEMEGHPGPGPSAEGLAEEIERYLRGRPQG